MQQAGDTITLAAGAYTLREPLARSAYGVLWRADGPGNSGPVAVKLVNSEQMAAADARQRERWVESARTEIGFLRALEPWDRRHIVRLLDSGEHAGLPAMALELLDGDLGRHVAHARASGHAIPFAQALEWTAQANQALGKVHQYGWRYLDLKPGNLLLDARRGAIKLADFGTNRALADPEPHSYAGTANWQAPEQFLADPAHGYRTDARTDYFALGALFYYLVTGGQPLRFCSACGEAYREHGAAGGVRLMANREALPAVLAADEEALFQHRIRASADGGGTPDAAGSALALLRALLAERPERRPRHALAISRLIAGVRTALRPCTPMRSAA
jgi:serine/threonine-protein kinase